GAARTIGNAVAFSGGAGVIGSLDITFTGPGTLTTNSTLSDGSTALTTFSVPIGESGGSRSLTINGSGTLRLSAANTFTGGLIVNSGNVLLGNNQSAGTGTLTLNGGAIVPDSGPRTLANAVVLNSTLTINGPLELSFTGPISGTGSIVKNGSQQLR